MENVFNHFHLDALDSKKRIAPAGKGFGSSRSIVLHEEAGLKLEQLYRTFRYNTQCFSWVERLREPAQHCHDMECLPYVDSDSDDRMEEAGSSKKKPKLQQKTLEYYESGGSILYGYGFECSDDSVKVTAELNLSRIFNILWLLPYNYPGLHSSYLYFGRTHSYFPVHVEDGLTLSLNYLFVGHPKLWQV